MADRKAERKQECVQVVIRCRPFSTKESNEGRGNVISMETALFQVRINIHTKVPCFLVSPYVAVLVWLFRAVTSQLRHTTNLTHHGSKGHNA